MAKRAVREAQNPLAARIGGNGAEDLVRTMMGGTERFGAAFPDAQITEDGVVTIGNYQLTAVGLVDMGATHDEWERIGRYFNSLTSSLTWLIADWMADGERVHGESYEAAAALVGRKVKTLYNWASIANRVDISRRRETLDFSHHAFVAALPDDAQDYWLQQAEHFKWSAKRLGVIITKYPNGLPDHFQDTPALPVTRDPMDRFQRAFTQFQQKTSKILRKAGPASRKQMAQWLREEADRLERGEGEG